MKTVIALIMLILSSTAIYADWDKTYGGENNDFGNAIVSTENGYIAVGQTDSFGNGKDMAADAWIMRLDKSGNEIWSKTYGIEDEKDGFSSVILKNDTIIAVGYSHFEMVLAKYDMNGELLSEKIIDNEIVAGILKIIDDGSGFVIAGMGRPNLIKLDYDGNFIWGKKYGDQIKSVIHTENGYIIVGNVIAKTVGIGIIVPGFMIYALDHNGEVLYDNPYEKSELGLFYSVTLSNDGGLVLAGDIIEELDGVEGHHSYMLKLDGQNFAKTWEYKGERFSSFVKVIEYNDAFIACGNSNSQDSYPDFKINRISSEGNLEYEDIFGGSIYDYPSDMIIDENTLVIIGQSERENSGKRYDMEIIRRDIDDIENIDDEKQLFNITVTPNPISENTCIELDLEASVFVRMHIMDIQGSTIEKFYQGILPAGHNVVKLPYNILNSSAYFLNIEIGDKIICKKIISKK